MPTLSSLQTYTPDQHFIDVFWTWSYSEKWSNSAEHPAEDSICCRPDRSWGLGAKARSLKRIDPSLPKTGIGSSSAKTGEAPGKTGWAGHPCWEANPKLIRLQSLYSLGCTTPPLSFLETPPENCNCQSNETNCVFSRGSGHKDAIRKNKRKWHTRKPVFTFYIAQFQK